MSDRNQQTVEWCLEVIDISYSKGLPAKIAEMQREVVREAAGSSAIYKIAEELADGIADLPSSEREEVNHKLRKYGFGYELFTEKKLKKLRSILGKGKIRNDDEFREVSSLASDMEIGDELRTLANSLLLDYESSRTQQPKDSSVTRLKNRAN